MKASEEFLRRSKKDPARNQVGSRKCKRGGELYYVCWDYDSFSGKLEGWDVES